MRGWTSVVDIANDVEFIYSYSLDKGTDDFDKVKGNFVFYNVCNERFVIGTLVVFGIVGVEKFVED